MGSSNKQFRLLLWKNWLLQKRKITLTVFEILLPTFFVLILLLIKQRVETIPIEHPTTWPTFNIGDELPSRLVPPSGLSGRWVIPYSPDVPVVSRVMSSVADRLDIIPQGVSLLIFFNVCLVLSVYVHVCTQSTSTHFTYLQSWWHHRCIHVRREYIKTESRVEPWHKPTLMSVGCLLFIIKIASFCCD